MLQRMIMILKAYPKDSMSENRQNIAHMNRKGSQGCGRRRYMLVLRLSFPLVLDYRLCLL